MANFDFRFVNSFAKFMKEKGKIEQKKYVVRFSRSTLMSVDGNKETKEYREHDIPVFEGSLEQCSNFVKLQALEFMMSVMDIEGIFNRDISLTETWQKLPRVRLSMYDYQDEKSWSSYTYYEVYDENYYNF